MPADRRRGSGWRGCTSRSRRYPIFTRGVTARTPQCEGMTHPHSVQMKTMLDRTSNIAKYLTQLQSRKDEQSCGPFTNYTGSSALLDRMRHRVQRMHGGKSDISKRHEIDSNTLLEGSNTRRVRNPSLPTNPSHCLQP